MLAKESYSPILQSVQKKVGLSHSLARIPSHPMSHSTNNDYNKQSLIYLENDWSELFLRIYRNFSYKDSKHLKLVLHATRYTLHDFDAIGFDLGYLDKELKINDTVDIVFTLDLNEFNGNKKLQLKLLDIREG